MKLDYIPLDRLSVSPANMRAKRAPDLRNILPSVRERGVLVPILVRPNGTPDSFEIVAGRRRYLAAKTVAEERGEEGTLPCGIMETGDDVAALEASLIENIARLDADEVTQWETFARLAKEGRGVDGIAATFGVTERLVRRVLALGNLLPRIRTLYRAEKIDAATVRLLTLATKAQQKDWLALYDAPDGYAPTGHRLKEWLFGGQAIATTAALFDVSLYTCPVITDLFGDDSYFADTEAFWSLQRAAIEAKSQGYLDAGWTACEVLQPGHYFQRWEYEKRTKAKAGRVYIAVSARGEVEVHEGWLPLKEARRKGKDDAAPKPARSLITAPLQAYIDLHKHAAVRAKLLDHPGVALRLMVAHAIAGSALWSVRPEPQRTDRPAVAESVETCASEAVFVQKRRAALGLLDFDPEASTVVRGESDLIAVFNSLTALTDEQVLSILAVVMGETLEAGSAVIDVLGIQINVDIATVWKADDAFFDLVRSKDGLLKMVTDVAGPEVAAANQGESGKVLKAIIRDCLDGSNGRAKVGGGTSAWLRFAAVDYPPSTAWVRNDAN